MEIRIAAMKMIVALFILLLASVSQMMARETRIKWFGHAAFSITTPSGKVLLIGPWLNNPSNLEARDGRDTFSVVTKVDYILLTRDHSDHVAVHDSTHLDARWRVSICVDV